MANTTSGTYTFDKNFSIDEIIEEAYERIGLYPNAGFDMKSARRSLNILFQEWANRGLHYWEVASNNITLVDGQNVYTMYLQEIAYEDQRKKMGKQHGCSNSRFGCERLADS